MVKKIELKKESFETLEYALLVVNSTSKTQILDPSKIEIVEYSRTKICLRLPELSCAEGHSLILFVAPKAEAKNLLRFVASKQGSGVMSVTGKVRSVEPASKKSILVWLDLIQFIEGEWRAFLKSYTDRQNQIDHILKEVKR